MSDVLKEQSCEACRIDAPVVCADQIPTLMTQIPNWKLIEQDGVQQLTRLYKFKNFKDAWAFGEKLMLLSEDEGHHPAILVEWGKVRVNWWSHSIKGLHKNDFIMASKTDALFE